MGAPVWAVLLAVTPVVVLAVLVLRAQPLTRSALVAAGWAGLLALGVFGLRPGELAIGIVRGVWTGAWILAIVLPALLLFEVLERSGALERMADASRQLAPTPGRQRLLIAWILPSFLQGAAGFGTPIAMAAPMLVRLGASPVAALSLCLVGYQWSVTFGSMGSSYFMAEGTARLGADAAASFALRTAVILALNCLVAGLLVLGRGREARRDLPVTLLLGIAMGGTLVAVVVAQPALGSVVAGLTGMLLAYVVLPEGDRPGGRDLLLAVLPYLALTGMVVATFGIPPVRALLERVPRIHPVLAGTEAAFGHVNPDAAVTPSFHPLLHPWLYLLLSAVIGILLYRRRGWWPERTTRTTLVSWWDRSAGVSASIVTLTVLASVMTESGMVTAIAAALAGLLGFAFVVVSPLLGAFGTALTGSTTASNALFSSLQADVARQLSLPVPALLSGQTAGGNIGNALSPVNIAVGAAVVGVLGREGEVVRRNLPAAGVLMVTVVGAVLFQALMAR